MVSEAAFAEMTSEFNHRFEMLADEIGTLKDIVLKLQSYTMEVNKTLMEERIHVLSDLGETTFSIGQVTAEDVLAPTIVPSVTPDILPETVQLTETVPPTETVAESAPVPVVDSTPTVVDSTPTVVDSTPRDAAKDSDTTQINIVKRNQNKSGNRRN